MSDDKALSFTNDHIMMEWLPEIQALSFMPIGHFGDVEAGKVTAAFGELAEEIHQSQGVEQVDFLANMEFAGQLTFAGRRKLQELVAHPRAGRVAAYNLSALHKTLITFILFAVGKRDHLHAAADREAAITWLHAKRARNER